MRGFFFLLLLTNVAFVGWQYLQHKDEQQIDPYQGIHFDKKGLTLLSELPADKRPALREGVEVAAKEQTDVASGAKETSMSAGQVDEPAAAQAAPSKQTPIAICLKVSGMEDRAEADKLLAGLKTLGVGGLQQGSSQGHDTNYWVMLPPYRNRDKAIEAAALLKEQHLKDFFIVRSGDYENAVSLGVFSTRERAQRRYDQVVGLNARLRKPRIESIDLPAKRYWVSLKLSSDEQRKAVNALVEKLGQKKGEEIACE